MPLIGSRMSGRRGEALRNSARVASAQMLKRIALGCLIVGAGLAVLWLLQLLFVMGFCVWGGQSCM
jgi:hypothetical protein